MKYLATAAASVALLVTAVPAKGEIIAFYTSASSTDNATLAPTFASPLVSAAPLTPGAGVNAASGSTFNFNGFDTDNTTAADAIADDEVFTFGFTTLSQAINLTDLDIRLDRSGTGPDDFEIFASVNGSSGASLLAFSFDDTDAGINFLNIDLGGLPTVFVGDTVVFTVAPFASEGTSGTFDFENFSMFSPSVVINGDVVPEPGTLALLGLGAVGVVRRRR